MTNNYQNTLSGIVAVNLRLANQEVAALEIDRLYSHLLDIANCNTTKDVEVLKKWACEALNGQ